MATGPARSTRTQELEVKEQERRAVAPERSNQTHDELPRGDDSRGWFSHWRRGIGGALQSWAQGSLFAVIFMLAFCAKRYGVVDELADELGLMRPSEVKKAKRCIYICERIRCQWEPPPLPITYIIIS